MNAFARSLAAPSPAGVGKYLTVLLNREAYGLAALKVREVIRIRGSTPVAQMLALVKGVIDLRRRGIAILDLRIKFGLKAEFTGRTCIVVVRVGLDSAQPVKMGLIVDAVEEVVNLTDADLEPTPEFGTRIDTSYLLGMAKIKGQVKTLLDIDRVVAADVFDQLARSG